MTSPTGSGLLRILVVDDEDSYRMGLEMALKLSHRYVAKSCNSAAGAMDELKAEAFDVIILDYNMPEMSGLDLLHWMQKEKINTPVIMLTAAGSETIAVEAMRLGVYDYFRKDQIDINRLPIAVMSVHERYLYRRDLHRREEEAKSSRGTQRDLESLKMFENSVNSLGQFVESSLSGLLKNLQRQEEEILRLVPAEAKGKCRDVFVELKKGIEVVTTGMKSMLDLTSLVTKKMESIQGTRSDDTPHPPTAG
jgi:DNA-binding NarL/FixJ family response regulator